MKDQEVKEAVTPRIRPASVDKRPRIIADQGVVVESNLQAEGFESWPRPSGLELATLAARLARTGKVDPKELVRAAWRLYWESCRKLRGDQIEVVRVLEELEAKADERLKEERRVLPQPKKFPVTFGELELLLLPKLKGRTGERAAVFREYALAQILENSFTFRGGFRMVSYWEVAPDALEELREQNRGEVATRYTLWRERVFDAEAYARFAVRFLNWYERWLVDRDSQLKSANARRGWVKRKAKAAAKAVARAKVEAKKEKLKAAVGGKKSGAGGLDKPSGQPKRKPQQKSPK